MTIGKLLKEYRLAQKKTQKEFASKVVSPSYYAKVEKNIHRIAAEDLLNLLRANQIPIFAFFSHLNKKDIQQPAFKNNKALKEKFIQLRHFTDDQIACFAKTMDAYDLASEQKIARRILRQEAKNAEAAKQLLLLKMISLLVTRQIEEGQEKEAAVFIDSADQINAGLEAIAPKFKIALCDQLIRYHKSRKKKHLKKIKRLLQALSISGLEDEANSLKKWVAKYKKV